MLEIHQKFFIQATRMASNAQCLRDKCGAIIVIGQSIISSGFNGPPRNDSGHQKCTYEFPLMRRKQKSDITCCVHAEWRAIMNAKEFQRNLAGGILYFARADEKGNMLFSGEPYCTVCSRLALDAGISQWALWHPEGIKLYSAAEYNDLSYEYHLRPFSSP